MELTEQAPTTPRPFLANSALLILALVGAAVAAAFFLPWFPRPDPGGSSLARYSPLEQGGARLIVDYDAAGKITGWSSQNETLLPPGLALAAQTRKSEREAINKFFRRPGETGELPNEQLIKRMAGSQVYHSRTRRLEADGKTSDSILLAIRNTTADYLISFYDPAADAETIFDPPIPILQADLSTGREWTATGKRLGTNGTLDYQYAAKVAANATFKNEAGEFEHTLKIETRLVFTAAGQTLYEGIVTYWLAPDIGSVELQTLDPAGVLKTRSAIVNARDRQLKSPSRPPSIPIVEKPSPPHAVEKWELSRFASTRSADDSSESSIPPTWIPTEPPTLLAARYGGGLTAFNANEPGAPALWRFDTGGTIYGQPAFDRERSRIYFGASDKRLYALDTRGLFLWSFPTEDNVVTRPVITGKFVLFGSEDRAIYWLNADTGEKEWKETLGGAIVSSPVLLDGLVIFGCDDGELYAFDVATHKERWKFSAESPIEAPITAADGRVFAGNNTGELFAIDPESGKELWSTKVGGELRTAPAFADDKLFIVNGDKRLCAYDAADGRRLWSSEEEDYVGPPIVVGETLIVGSEHGDAHAVDLSTGHRHGEPWSAANASSPSDGAAALRIGATEGGGAIWFADTKSVIRRLGPLIVGPVALKASWLLPFSKEPLTGHFLTVAPVAYGDQALVIDGDRDIFLLDPATGKGSRIGTFGETNAPSVQPTVAGDTLLSLAGTTLYATALPSGAARWKFDPKEGGSQPVTVVGETVLWLTQHFPPDGNGKTAPPIGTLHGLDLNTGAVRWERQLGEFTGIGMALTNGTLAFTTAPAAAFDLASGEPRWQAQVTDSTLGGGALNESGDTLFIGLLNRETSAASMAAIATADGSVMWQHPIGQSPLHPLERAWLAGEVLVVPLWSGEVIGVSAMDGAEVWRYKPAKPRYGGISVAADRIWFAENNARLVALDARTGRVAAQLALDIDIGNIQAFAPRPLIIGDRVIAPLAIALLGLKNPGSAPAAAETKPEPHP